MADIALQRKNMVESQVRPSDVTDRRIITAMLAVPREAFLPAEVASLAYSDGELTLAKPSAGRPRRALMAPRTFARLLDSVRLGPREVVLDVGAACGYSAAVIGRLVETVVGLESDKVLAGAAGRAVAAQSQDNVAIVEGDLVKGWPDAGPYDAIVVEGAIAGTPETLLAQLKDGGRLVAVLEDATSSAVVWTRRGDGFDRRVMFDASAPRLPGFEARKPAFQL